MSPMDHRPAWHAVFARLASLAKFTAKAIPFSLVLLLVLLVVFHGHLIDDIYKNVDDLNDGEMPITVTSYESGPEVVSIIGGSGEGLNCSLPRGFDVFFDGSPDLAGNRHLVRQLFRQACVFHDLCYRHGLATYGYSQNDCDRTLQNQAFRLCKYIRSEDKTSDSERCQQDSKKLLAGVSLGGFGAYRAWDRSTFFEFDPHPTRSTWFSASRVVDHPFKSVDPEKYKDEAQQVVLTFENKRSNLTVQCATCKNRKILGWSQDPQNVSSELVSVGIQSRPEALIGRELFLASKHAVWLPPRRDHGAPQLLVDATGKHHLIWMSRVDAEHTGSCIVKADAAKLLTYTLPKRDVCHVGAGSRLAPVQAEMYASSPVPMALAGANPPEDILAIGLTPQRDLDRSLSLCLWSERIRAKGDHTGGDEAACSPLRDEKIAAGKGLGAFQNFAVVRPGQQIFFARDVTLRPASSRLAGFFEHVDGNIYSTTGSIVVVDIAAPTPTMPRPGVVTLSKVSPFAIDDRFDPMMPITRTKDDLRFLSLLASDHRLGVHLTDFARDEPLPREIQLTMGGTLLDLHSSWGQRPALVVETKEPAPKTQLIFSRGHLIAAPDQLADTVRLETLVLERDARDPGDKPFSVTGGAACTVKYTFKQNNPDRECLRAFEPTRPMRPSPAAMMKASQLLVGRFGGGNGLGLAFVDLCMDQHPLVLAPKPDGSRSFAAITRVAEQHRVKREIDCTPLHARESIGRPMAD